MEYFVKIRHHLTVHLLIVTSIQSESTCHLHRQMVPSWLLYASAYLADCMKRYLDDGNKKIQVTLTLTGDRIIDVHTKVIW